MVVGMKFQLDHPAQSSVQNVMHEIRQSGGRDTKERGQGKNIVHHYRNIFTVPKYHARCNR